jgi:uncharacterized protein (DUF2235 family)
MDSNHLKLASTQSADSGATLSSSPQASTFQSSSNGTVDSALPPCIPIKHGYRTLVLCFDGTGDQFDTDNSNIVEFFGLLKKDDPSQQLVYYQAGIGTYTIPQIATPFFAKVSKLVDEAIAWDLDAHVMGGYEFLMQNYAANDRICIFGFSRGAYTARCLAGMIHKVGLLPTCNHQQIPFAYKMYTTADDKGWKQSNDFKKTFSIDVDIEFLGVWDTVNSVGIVPRRLPFATSNTIVRTFRHAVSLDERRAKFKANLWNRPQKHEALLSITDQKIAEAAKLKAKASADKAHHQETLWMLEHRYGKERLTPTDVEEVWFAGGHCDVGGGSVDNGVKPCLARIPFRWMIRECFKTNSGIIFHTEELRKVGLDPATLYPVVRPRPPAIPINPTSLKPHELIQDIPKSSSTSKQAVDDNNNNNTPNPAEVVHSSEEEEDLRDSLAPLYDELKLGWTWWILEILPLIHKFQDRENKWISSWGMNLGTGRHIPLQETKGVKVHRAVKTRLDSETRNGKKYWPNAKNWDLKHVTWVD